MGIPVYFSHIIKEYNFILKKIQHLEHFDVFFLDANSIIYDVYYSLINNSNNHTINNLENKIIENTINKINFVINLFNVEKEVVVCFDGVAPLSKLKQQRERRFKSWIKSDITEEQNKWNTCSITPGTQFMKKLNEQLDNYKLNYYKLNNDRKEKITILDSRFNGEGEQKIFDYLKNHYPNPNQISTTMMKVNLKICIYGLDSDLIMLSLLHNNFYNSIYLYRETPEFIKNLNKNFDPNEKYLLNINSLSNCLTKTLYGTDTFHFINNNNILSFRANINYIILFFMVGNDFVPHHPGLSLRLNAANDLIDIYKYFLQENDLFYILNNKFYIDWNTVKIVMKELAKKEFDNMNEYYEYKINIKNKIMKNDKIMKKKDEVLNYIPIFNNENEKFILSNKDVSSLRYYIHSFGSNYNVKDISYHYLKNLEWNFFYYLGQEECNYNYYYPYYHAPLFNDCVKYIPLKIETLYDKNIVDNKKFIHHNTQLLYILPSTYYNLIDSNIINNIELKNHYNFEILFKEPSKLILDIDHNFVKYFFESVIHFKYININLLDKQILELVK
ncbi:hypothetical protein CL656_05310 [bacterium]|nr:hypothetical protein [bacterium]|tara:strand:- start:906 stop:2582 length:1677 start_codon:yes stop_codon:yes gene_type:complete